MGRRRGAGRSLPPMVAVCLAGSLVAPVSAAADERGGAPTTALEWGARPEGVPAGTHPLECATVPVPVDYGAPEGDQIEIMVSRLASTDPEQRRGVLLLDPGGPGGSGSPMPAGLASLGMPASVLDSYDLIGMDTRGGRAPAVRRLRLPASGRARKHPACTRCPPASPTRVRSHTETPPARHGRVPSPVPARTPGGSGHRTRGAPRFTNR
ncbi:hypothetical protein [Nocardiopsis dassonvillei]|uniref:hypothetical protein n=1 Tax=Nocardiopsis dassonvillei TaxID=2014 RepID=UPI0036372CE0